MFKYFVKDMMAVLKYLPFGIIASVFVAFVYTVINKLRVEKGKEPYRVWANTFFIVYFVIMLLITFFSRETGNSHVLDLQLFSTLRINDRNNAYILENIVFFIPYGYLLATMLVSGRYFWGNLLLGFITSFFIEWVQYVSGRGVFQIDDIWTNVIGSIIGFLLYKMVQMFHK